MTEEGPARDHVETNGRGAFHVRADGEPCGFLTSTRHCARCGWFEGEKEALELLRKALKSGPPQK